MNYFDHADARGLDVRRLAAASRADRARMLATLAERELGCITITMSAAELRARLREAWHVRLWEDRRWMPIY